MYCPHCGNESSGELNYCKRCGGNLNPVALAPSQEARAPIATGTAWAIGTSMLFLIVMGLGVLFSIVRELSHSPVPPPVLILTIIFGSLTILGGASLLTVLWMRLLGSPRAAGVGGPVQLRKPSSTHELPPARVNAFNGAPIPSVTEHTTRTFDNVRK